MAGQHHRYFVTAPKGTEGALRDELRAIGLRRVKADRGGVGFEGDLEAGMRACLWSRIGARVLLHLGGGKAPDSDGLYAAASTVPWEAWLDPDRTFAVHATLRRANFDHSGFVALKTKDAIADRLKARRGRRPNVDPKRPDVSVAVHVAGDTAAFYLDMSGESLHRRGWRARGGEAPLKENLAAAVLRLGGYDPALPLVDPLCGSGTLAIEAAGIARRLAPGLGRGFGFERWPAFDAAARGRWQALRETARANALPRAPAPILGRDISTDAIVLARQGAKRAGVAGDIIFAEGDARDGDAWPGGCQVFTNPPYGERLGRRRLQLEGFYRQLGEAWLASPKVERIVVLSGNPALPRRFPRRPERAHTLYNGPLRCQLLTWTVNAPAAPG